MPTGKELVLGTLFKGRIDPQFDKQVKRLENSLRGLNAIFDRVNKKAAVANKSIKSLGTGLNKASAAPKKLGKSTELMNKQIAKAGTGYQRFMGALKVTASYGIAATAMYKLVQGITAGIKEIAEFDQSLKNLQAITGASSLEISAMGEALKDVARDTKFSTAEVANGMVLLGQAGFSAEESLSAIRATANLATGTLSDMAVVSDLLTTTIRAYNLSAEESGRVSDVMANAINKSKLTVDKLRVAFNFVGATAAQAGLSIEQTAATMMTLANNGLRASTIGTGFRQVLSRLIAPSRKLRETMAEYGIELEKINPIMQGWEGALGNLTKVLFDSERKTIDVAKAFELFGLRGAQAVTIIAKSYLSGDFQKALDNAFEVGTAAEMAGIQAEGLIVKFKNLQDRAKLVALAIGEGGLTGVFKILLDVMRDVAAAVETFLLSDLGKVTILFIGVETAIIGVILALKGLKAVASSIGLLQFIASPLGIVLAALGGFAAAMIHFSKGLDIAAEQAGKLSVQNLGLAKSINLYREGLDQLNNSMAEDAPRQYEALLKRFIAEYPELAKQIKVTTLSHEELIAALSVVEYEEQQKALSNLTKAMGVNADKMNELIDQANNAVQKGTFYKVAEGQAEVASTSEDAAFWQARLSASMAKVSEIGLQYVSTLVEVVRTQHQSAGSAWAMLQAWLKVHEITGTVAQSLRDTFAKSLDALNSTTLDMSKGVAAALDQMPIEHANMFKELDVLRQADLVKAIRSADQQVATFQKAANKMGLVAEEREEAIAAIRTRAIVDFLVDQEKIITGEKVTAERRIQIIQDFKQKVEEELAGRIALIRKEAEKIIQVEQATGAKREEIETLMNAKIEQARGEHSNKMAGLDLLMNRNLLQAQRERLESIIAGHETEINARREHILKLNRLDELAVARRTLDADKAALKKERRERDFLKLILKLRKEAVDKSKKLYGQDSDNYKEALSAKKEAEENLAEAMHEKRLGDIERKQKALDDADKETLEKNVETNQKLQDQHSETVSFIKRNKIVVDADISPAQAALTQLLSEYKSKIAAFMALYAEQVTSGFSSIGNKLAQGYADEITRLQDMAERLKLTFATSPVLNSGGSLSTGSDIMNQKTIPSTSPTNTGGDLSGTHTSGSPPQTIDWYFNLPGGQSPNLTVVDDGNARQTIEEIGSELERMGLSYSGVGI